ncbi:hypothetical protein GJ496_011381 [Pomphorhynchus laevis]|nr:hypothetical protein GJ496_011381 [Pomphorhynchus laevis]
MGVTEDSNHNGNGKLVKNDVHTIIPEVIPTRIYGTSDFVALNMKCTSDGCSLRTYVRAPRLVSHSFFLQDFFYGQCTAQQLFGLKEEIDELRSRIDGSSLTYLGVQNCKCASKNDSHSLASVARRAVNISVLATAMLPKDKTSLKLIHECDRQARRASTVIIRGLPLVSDEDANKMTLFASIGVNIDKDFEIRSTRLPAKRSDTPPWLMVVTNESYSDLIIKNAIKLKNSEF